MAASPANTLLAGRYRVLRRLGGGGMATVFLAEDERLGRQVALKRLHADSPEEMARRFEREAKLLATLNHPNVVGVYDTATDDEGVLIVMEYVDGEPLSKRLESGPLEPDEALAVIDGIASALDHAHEHGVVHRDVKPANVLLGRDGNAKLADLGIATAAEGAQLTRTGAVLGTPSYMAPEQLEGRPTSPAVDVYALAAVAFEVLGGRKAREGKTPIEIAHRAATEPPPDIRELRPELPAALATVLARGMASDPAERPGGAGRFARELREAAEEPAEARPAAAAPAPAAAPPSAAPAPSRAAPAWLRPLVLALLALALAGGLVALLAGGDDDAPQRDSTQQQADPPERRAPPAAAPEEAAPAQRPEQTVAAFYERSAADDFDGAWELAGPGFRSQLGGFESFRSTVGTLERVQVERAETTSQSGDGATVAFEDVAVHTDRRERCSGTFQLTRGGPGWLIDRASVGCTRLGGGGGGAAKPKDDDEKGGKGRGRGGDDG